MELRLAMGQQQVAKEIGDAIEGLIAMLDEIDGDIDLEPEEDRCDAGDDGVFSGSVLPLNYTVLDHEAGDDIDAEPDEPQARKLHITRIRRTAATRAPIATSAAGRASSAIALCENRPCRYVVRC